MGQERIKIIAELDTRQAEKKLADFKQKASKVTFGSNNAKVSKTSNNSNKIKIDVDDTKINQLQTKINKISKDTKNLKLSTSVDSKEFDKFQKNYSKILNDKTKLNLGVKVDNAGQITKIQNQIEKLRKDTKSDINVRFNVKQDSNIFNQINKNVKAGGQVLTGAIGAIGSSELTSSIINQANQARNTFASIEDRIIDVAKSTGLSNNELKNFRTSIFEIGRETRTQIPALLDIAQIGGQIGINKDGIITFTDAINKLNVALGDEFSGGAGQIVTEVGKLATLDKDIKATSIDEKILKIGNVLNELGASGLATGEVVTDFARRIQGLAPKLGTANILGLSASLQELGVEAERGGSTIGRLVNKISDADGVKNFAQLLGITTKEYKNLVNADPNQALLRIAETLQRKFPTQTGLSKALDDLGLDGVYASEVIQKLGNNIDLVKAKQKLAGATINNTNSILDEYSRKNNTAQAEQEKFNNRITELKERAGEPLAKVFNDILDKSEPFIDKLIEFVDKNPDVVTNFVGLSTALGGIATALAGISAGKGALTVLSGLTSIGTGAGATSASAGLALTPLAGSIGLSGLALAPAGITGGLEYSKNGAFKNSLDSIAKGELLKDKRTASQNIGLVAGGISGFLTGRREQGAFSFAQGSTEGAITGAKIGDFIATEEWKKFFTVDLKNWTEEGKFYLNNFSTESRKNIFSKVFTDEVKKNLKFIGVDIDQFVQQNKINFEEIENAFVNAFRNAKNSSTNEVNGLDTKIINFVNSIPTTLQSVPTYFLDQFQKAKENVNNKFEEIQTGIEQFAESIAGAFDIVPDRYGSVFKQASEQIKRYIAPIDNAIKDSIANISNLQNNANNALNNILGGNRAEGGWVQSGTNYRVNELGNELFMSRNGLSPINGDFFSPRESGFVIPASLSQQLKRANRADVSNNTNITINANTLASSTNNNANIIAKLVADKLYKQFKNA